MAKKTITIICAILFTVIGSIVIVLMKQPTPQEDPTPQKQDQTVLTTFYPTQYFAQTISHGTLTIHCLCPADEDPIFWMPDRTQLAEYQRGLLIIVNGAGFEKWLEKVSLPRQRLVDTAKKISPLIYYQDVGSHSHGPVGEHSHEGVDGHTWVDPLNAIVQAKVIHDEFVKHFPKHKREFDDGLGRLKKQLEDLDRQFEQISADSNHIPILCSHPAYNYIARRYGWNIRNLDLDPEVRLSDKQIAEIREILNTYPAKTLVWESAPAPENIRLLKEQLGLDSVVFSPCELMSPDDLAKGIDYIKVMNSNLETMRTAFSGVK
jgi:zinc transport system substrate-binding protein